LQRIAFRYAADLSAAFAAMPISPLSPLMPLLMLPRCVAMPAFATPAFHQPDDYAVAATPRLWPFRHCRHFRCRRIRL
jgi:hypothetical protein